jgi:Mrp family chromosome partitioning ATPase
MRGSSLPSQILDWLQRRPSAMEMYLRPGCVHVSAYLAMPGEHWQAVRDALEESLLLILTLVRYNVVAVTSCKLQAAQSFTSCLLTLVISKAQPAVEE